MSRPESDNTVIIDKILDLLKWMAESEGKRTSRIHSAETSIAKLDQEVGEGSAKLNEVENRIIVLESKINTLLMAAKAVSILITIGISVATLMIKYCE